MPLIDLHCHLGWTAETLALRPPSAEQARQYADQFGVELLCFSAPLAAVDAVKGNESLVESLKLDKRFNAWLTLSVHQADVSSTLARRFLVGSSWFGTQLEQTQDSDAVNLEGGRALLNALRRYGKPVLLTVTSPATLQAALDAAREFTTLKFLISPQSEYLTAVAVPSIKEAINTVLLPVAAFSESDVVARAVEILGERRVAWASDWGRFHPAAALGMIRDSALGPSQRERVGYRNARELTVT